MKGVLDKQAINIFNQDINDVLNVINTSINEGKNKEFLESRIAILEEEASRVEERRNTILEEFKVTVSKLKGELISIDQLFKYLYKEIGVCELALDEMKDGEK